MNTWKYVYGKRYLNSYKKMVKKLWAKLKLNKIPSVKGQTKPSSIFPR